MDAADLVPWALGGVALLLFLGLILWMATKVERERAGNDSEPRIRVNSVFSGPVGTGIYKPIDDRRKAANPTGEEDSSEHDE